MKYIELPEENFLGKGRERACYLHPLDNTKVIKIVYRASEKLNQNQLEYEYLMFLQKKGKSFEHLSKCYGCISTNLGEGYIFERVRDYDGKTSVSFKSMVLKGTLPIDTERELLEELKVYLLENNIIFVDIALSNIFCQAISASEYKLILTDGIGGKRTGIKSKLYLYSESFTRYKVKKQWKKLFARYDKVVKKGIEANTRNSQ